ncbi:MAG: hypothetical protein QW134_00995 [Nitrososphaeria archaeon]
MKKDNNDIKRVLREKTLSILVQYAESKSTKEQAIFALSKLLVTTDEELRGIVRRALYLINNTTAEQIVPQFMEFKKQS